MHYIYTVKPNSSNKGYWHLASGLCCGLSSLVYLKFECLIKKIMGLVGGSANA